MSYLFVHHEVEDYKKWKTVFDAHSFARSETGSKGEKFSEVQTTLTKFLFCWSGIA